MKIWLILGILFTIYANSVTANNALNFKNQFVGITRQTYNYSCGAAALSTLINGTIQPSAISEKKVMNTIRVLFHKKHHEYSLNELEAAAKKLGYVAETKAISPLFLPQLQQPVLLLVGLNTQSQHFIVLKGILNGVAYLADPARGHIHKSYQKIIAQSINKKYPLFYIMAIKRSAERPINSRLYLSNNAKAIL